MQASVKKGFIAVHERKKCYLGVPQVWQLVETKNGQGKASVKKGSIAMHAIKSCCSAYSSTKWAVILLFSISPLEDKPLFSPIGIASNLDSASSVHQCSVGTTLIWQGRMRCTAETAVDLVLRGSAWIGKKASCKVDAVTQESKPLQASRL